MVDDLVDRVGEVLEPPVGQLDPAQILGRNPRELLGDDPELPMCQVSIASPPFGAPAPLDHRQRRVEGVDVDVERHEFVHDPRVGVLRCVLAQGGELLGQPLQLARRPGDVSDLDVMGVEGRGGVKQKSPHRVGLGARRLTGRDEEVGEELDLEVAQAGVSKIDCISLSVRVSSWCEMSACHSPSPVKPTRAAFAQRSRQSNRLHSRPVCTWTGPETVQYRAISSVSPIGCGRPYRRPLGAASQRAQPFLPISAVRYAGAGTSVATISFSAATRSLGPRDPRRVIGVDLEHRLAVAVAQHPPLHRRRDRVVLGGDHVRPRQPRERLALVLGDGHAAFERRDRLRAVLTFAPLRLLGRAAVEDAHPTAPSPVSSATGGSPETTMFAWTLSSAASG